MHSALLRDYSVTLGDVTARRCLCRPRHIYAALASSRFGSHSLDRNHTRLRWWHTTFHIAHRTSQTQNPQPEIQNSHSTSPPTWKVLHLHQQADSSRCAWLLGIARPPLSAETAHEPLPAPRSPQRSTRAGTHPASPITPAKALAAEGGEVEEREKEKAKGSVRRRARGT